VFGCDVNYLREELNGSVDATGAPVANIISGNPMVGLYIYSSAVTLSRAKEISNNGSGMQLLHAGVRVDLNASLIAVGSGDIKITGNIGSGIEATTGGNVYLSGTVVTSNSQNGVRLRGNGRRQRRAAHQLRSHIGVRR